MELADSGAFDDFLVIAPSGRDCLVIGELLATAQLGWRLREAIEKQPPWSDFPFVLLTRRGETRQGSRSIEELVNVTILERPLHPASLISAARAALRGRLRQRLAARHLADLERARGELREPADTLETKVEDRTRDLAAANDRLTPRSPSESAPKRACSRRRRWKRSASSPVVSPMTSTIC